MTEKYLGHGIQATMRSDLAICLLDGEGNYILMPEDSFQNLVKFRAAAQVEIALRQSLAPAFQFIESNPQTQRCDE